MLFRSLLEYTGIEPGRIFFSWISSSEANRFALLASEITSKIKELGPNNNYIKQSPIKAAC